MAQRKGWDRLKPDYRDRLINKGVTRESYDAGGSLRAGRGHANTPEHPLAKDAPIPRRYQKWYNQRYNPPIKVLTTDGEVWLISVSKRHRSLVGSHWNAVNNYLFGSKNPPKRAWWWSGDRDRSLDPFIGRTIKGIKYHPEEPLGDIEIFTLLTDHEGVEDWTYSDDVSFNSMYE